ncbi:hypothetical protein MPH_01404 [Macrophomina phaseolina MS6]|uniref:Uncharacterized protein n=1 Tax=Macrophomina phaseolina (strain MS6) TaxID=1126212 RepID=K2RFF8_MACPH|nr:hypothetical protein MPH_01404 [Macrophomina phaseolina MS6]
MLYVERSRSASYLSCCEGSAGTWERSACYCLRVRSFRLLVVISTVVVTLLGILSISRVEGHSVSAFEGCPFAARLRGVSLSRTHLPFVHATVDLRRKVYHFLEGGRVFVGNYVLLDFFLQAFVEEVAESLV